MQRARIVVAAIAAAAALSSCGENSTTTSTASSPEQSENARRIRAYILAVGKANEPFAHPPTERITHAQAERLLRTAIAELSALTPPSPFAASHGRVLSGFRGELSARVDIEHAERVHNSIAERNAEAKNARSEQTVRTGLVETEAEVRKCEQDNFTC